MRTFVVLAVSIVLVGILFCPMVMAAPSSIPADLQIVQPDPSLPKELSSFFGKWEGRGRMEYFLIVEKIDEQKASLYFWQSNPPGGGSGWMRYEAQVIKEGREYKLWFQFHLSDTEVTLKGEELDWSAGGFAKTNIRFKRVPLS
ncbi:MAG: hypothetical protein H6Q41_3339 [Deltaproteobacteria bacterium]|jgi:hypothetical protein|nr:hypothetical protein [Deltaproteobacteria bacterium]